MTLAPAPFGSFEPDAPREPADPVRAARLTDLWLAHSQAVAAYARRRVAGHAVDDIVAEVFTVAWRRLDAVPSGGQARPWLLAVARRVCSTHYRSEDRWRALGVRLAAQPARAAASAEDAALTREDAARAFAALTEEDREVLMLTAWDGLSQRDAARVLGINRAAYAARLRRARQRFDALFGGQSSRAAGAQLNRIVPETGEES